MNKFNNGYAFIIGISDYSHTKKLPHTVSQDAEDIVTVLIDPTTCGYPIEQVRLITDGAATKKKIIEGLQWLIDCTTPQDTVIIYFSGHGTRVETAISAETYLLPVDADLHHLDTTAVQQKELTYHINKIGAGRLVVIFDCCHAGGLGDIKGVDTSQIQSGLSESFYEQLNKGAGCAILASSKSDQYSWVLPGWSNSLFTHYLLETLRGNGYTPQNNLITLFSAFSYISSQVANHKINQTPIMKAELENDIPIALYLGNKTKNKKWSYNPCGTSDITSAEEAVLKALFIDYDRVSCLKEMNQGLTGARILLVRPEMFDGPIEHPVIAKIGPADLIHQEVRPFADLKINRLIGNVIELKTHRQPEGSLLAGLLYDFAGQGIIQLQSFATYCREAELGQTKNVMRMIFASFRASFNDTLLVPDVSTGQVYDLALPINLLLKQTSAETPAETILTPDRQSEQLIDRGQFVKIQGFQITEIDHEKKLLTLDLPKITPPHFRSEKVPTHYRVRVQISYEGHSFEVGQIITTPIVGVVQKTRSSMLNEYASEAFGEPTSHTPKELLFADTHVPNPLALLPALLSKRIPMKIGHIHGDLNLENILILGDQGQLHVKLIDMANARLDHILHDLLRMESNLIFHLVAPVLEKDRTLKMISLLDFFRSLREAALGRKDSNALPATLKNLFEIIWHIREQAKALLANDSWDEYDRGLAIYLIGGLKFRNLTPHAKQVAFWSAAVCLKILSDKNFTDKPKVKNIKSKRKKKTKSKKPQHKIVTRISNIKDSSISIVGRKIHEGSAGETAEHDHSPSTDLELDIEDVEKSNLKFAGQDLQQANKDSDSIDK